MKVIAITNQKGGTRKTTTAAAVGFGLYMPFLKAILQTAVTNKPDISFLQAIYSLLMYLYRRKHEKGALERDN